MSEPIRTSAAKRDKLATALKRNMARRKAVRNDTPTKRLSEPCVAEGEPQSGWGQRSVGATRSEAKRGEAKEAPSIKGEA